MTRKSVMNLVDIYLDNKNPRHEPIRDQLKIIEYLYKNEDTDRLLADIAKIGLSPFDVFGVMKKDGHYIALEGNRRICAIKLLNQPELAPSGSINKIKTIVANAKFIPTEVDVAIFPNRKTAQIWLDRRHDGAHGGIGIKQWTAEQKTRRNTNNQKRDSNALAQGLLDYAKKLNLIGDFEKRVLTTASRFLGNPFFRKSAGIKSSRSSSDVVINVQHEDFERFLKKFCDDLVEGNKVHSRTNKADWENYTRELMQQGYITGSTVENRKLAQRAKYVTDEPDAESDENNSSEKEDSNNNTNNNEGSNNNSSGSKDPSKRLYIAGATFRPTMKNKVLRWVFKELKSVLVDDNPLAVCLVTRAFLEKTYKLYHEQITGNSLDGTETHKVINKVIAIIEKDTSLNKAQKNSLGFLRKVCSDKSHTLSPQVLGAHAHAAYYPDPIQLKREWDNIEAIVQYMVDCI